MDSSLGARMRTPLSSLKSTTLAILSVFLLRLRVAETLTQRHVATQQIPARSADSHAGDPQQCIMGQNELRRRQVCPIEMFHVIAQRWAKDDSQEEREREGVKKEKTLNKCTQIQKKRGKKGLKRREGKDGWEEVMRK